MYDRHMRDLTVRLLLVFLLAIPAAAVSAQPPVPETDHEGIDGLEARRLLAYYFDLLQSGNYESASYLWGPTAQERSARFPITYTGILPLKVDCTNPIIRSFDEFRNHLMPASRQFQIVDTGKLFSVDFWNIVSGRRVDRRFYVEKLSDHFYFTYPQDVVARDWPVRESEFYRLRVHPDRVDYLTDVLLAAADEQVRALADSLGLSTDVIELLRTRKIEHFYCDDDSTVTRITGQTTKGMLDLASNDIISAYFPHQHEVVHLLVNIKLGELPFYSNPFLREGIAVRYGGRWGKSPSTLADLGINLYQQGFLDLDSTLTMARFQAYGSPDLVYPVAGLFCDYLLEQAGEDRFWELYRTESASFDVLFGRTLDETHGNIMAATRHLTWDDVIEDFDDWLDRYVDQRAATVPGLETSRNKVVDNSDGWTVYLDRDWLSIEVDLAATSGRNRTFFFATQSELEGVPGLLFEDLFGPGFTNPGHRFAVRVDQNEAGLYDLVTHQLVAKYVWGLSPSDDYFDADAGIARVSFRRSLIGDAAPSGTEFSSLNQ